MNFYNDNDPFCHDWLQYLACNHFIPGGVFDDQSIREISASDLSGFRQCHFFAGIGGWSRALEIIGWPRALEIIGWPADAEIWTASCPCQPFSRVGKRRGFLDRRHLWPVFCSLIENCRPTVVAGEQVASPAGWDWFASVRFDLEELGYAVGASGLCAASVGAPHIRERIYWMAFRADQRLPFPWWEMREPQRSVIGLGSGAGDGSGLHDAVGSRLEGLGRDVDLWRESGRVASAAVRPVAETASHEWLGVDFIRCADGKARPVKPGILPVAHGVSGRVGLIRGYGNAIVPQVAAAFIEVMMSYG